MFERFQNQQMSLLAKNCSAGSHTIDSKQKAFQMNHASRQAQTGHTLVSIGHLNSYLSLGTSVATKPLANTDHSHMLGPDLYSFPWQNSHR